MKNLKIEPEKGIAFHQVVDHVKNQPKTTLTTTTTSAEIDGKFTFARATNLRYWMGIDPGKNGFIIVLTSEGFIISHPIPLINKEVDDQALQQIIEQYKDVEITVCMEDVHSVFGASAKSNFQFGRIVGKLQGILAAHQMSFFLVQPKIWQKVCFAGVPIIEKPGTKAKGASRYDNKAMALVAVKRLYPKEDLRKSERAEKPHDGKVDALLLAHYCKSIYA